MKQIIIFLTALTLLILCSESIFAQGIRKDYLEMTDAERDALIDAYWILANDADENGPVGGLIWEIGDFHGEHFQLPDPDPIHFNTPSLDVFLAWHRQTSFELQRAMKETMGNEWITIPYWDWTISNSKSDPLWGEDWIGPFNTAWKLGRFPSSKQTFPSQTDIDNALNESNFYQFSRWELESDPIHTRGHTWTGGVMASRESPKDPAFFFHHNMVDKIWADWYELHGVAGADYYIKTDMPRFDGGYTNALGDLLPSVDPDDVADPRSLGIFYAEDGLAILDKYSVSNTYTPDEKFGYQYTIEAKDNFIVPPSKSATFKSCDKIILEPGFHAQYEATFEAKIDIDCDFSTSAKIANPEFVNHNMDQHPLIENAYSLSSRDQDQLGKHNTKQGLIKGFTTAPNPFKVSSNISFDLKQDAEIDLSIYDMNGRKVKQIASGRLLKGTHEFSLKGDDLTPSVYLVKLIYNDEIQTKKVVLTK